MFLFEVTRPVVVERTEFREGTLEWKTWDQIPYLNLPETDRRVIYPLFHEYRGKFFSVHIDCHPDGSYEWRVEHPVPGTGPVAD